MDILENENVTIDWLTGHGGLFKTPIVEQKYMEAACKAPITCMETAGEGGPYGMALLAAYSHEKLPNKTLEDYLNGRVFKNAKGTIIRPDSSGVEDFNKYIEEYKKLLKNEQTAVEVV